MVDLFFELYFKLYFELYFKLYFELYFKLYFQLYCQLYFELPGRHFYTSVRPLKARCVRKNANWLRSENLQNCFLAKQFFITTPEK